MSMPATHPDFDRINDLVDRRLPAREARETEQHLERCEACRATYDGLQDVLAAAASAPRAIVPPEDLWPALRREIDRRKEIPLPFVERVAPWTREGRWQARARLAVAAVLLMALSAGATAVYMRADREGLVATRPSADDTRAVPALLPAAVVAAEAGYLRTAESLQAALAARRDSLSPATIATVEHSLRIIDDAIAEARAALLADPASVPLAELLSAHYERKLDLLRRASELEPRT